MLALALLLPGCGKKKPILRDQIEVEQNRARITKVRNAIDETRQVIAASKGAPYLPELYLRLGELTSEEARYHYMVAYEREQGKAATLHVPQVRILKQQAIGTYNLILNRYPDTELADRVVFNISQEQRELGEFEDMVATLEKLVRVYPNSRYRMEALLVLGNYHYDKASFGKARDYFQQIIDLDAKPLLGLSHYKLAWVHLNTGDCEKSMRAFEAALDAAKDYAESGGPTVAQSVKMRMPTEGEFAIPDERPPAGLAGNYESLDVKREALVDLTYCYAQVRKPEEAATYLSDRASNRESYVAALGKMANRFGLIEQPRGAAEVARELLRLAPDAEERVDDARALHNALTRMGDYSRVGEDVELILKAMRRRSLHPDLEGEGLEVLRTEFEVIARDLALRSDQALRGEAEPSEWTKEPANPDDTASAYRSFLVTFPESEHLIEMTLNLADVLMDDKRFLEAGHTYRDAAALLANPPAPKTDDDGSASAQDDPAPAPDADADEPATDEAPAAEEGTDAAADAAAEPEEERDWAAERINALYNAAVAYQQFLESEGPKSHQERAVAAAGLRAAGGEWLVTEGIEPAKAQTIQFAIARSWYDEGEYLRAIDLLTAVAYRYPGTEAGNAAALMVLDSYNTINDISGLINVGRRFVSAESPIAADVKASMTATIQGAEQRRLDDLSLAASGEQPGGMEVLLAFADRYQDSDLGERALLGTFVAARASGDAEQLYNVGGQILKRFPDSEQVSGVASTMGQTAAARYEFETALAYLEQASELAKDKGQSSAILVASGELREQLSDIKGAEKAYLAAIELGAGRADAVRHYADLIERTRSPKEVVKALEPFAEPFDPEIASRLGLAYLREGKPDEAEMQLRRVVDGTISGTGSLSRSNYGMAEIMLTYLEDFEPPPELDAIEELIGLAEVSIQSYLAAARQPDPIYQQAALSRLAYAAELGASKLDNFKLPATLSDQERGLLENALKQRAAGLRAGRDEALAACGQRARQSHRFDAAGRACVLKKPPTKDPVDFEVLKPRSAAKPDGLDEARDGLGRNPNNVDALRIVGRAYLDAGDPHAARIALGAAVEQAGDAEDLLLLGRANAQAGDRSGALKAFARAKDAGVKAAAKELNAIYGELGLSELAKEGEAEKK